MDVCLDGLEHSQEEFHQVFDIREEDIQVLKQDMGIMKIKMSSIHKDMKDVEASINNAHFRLETVEDCTDGLAQSIQSNTRISSTQSHAALLEVQMVEKELCLMIEG